MRNSRIKKSSHFFRLYVCWSCDIPMENCATDFQKVIFLH